MPESTIIRLTEPEIKRLLTLVVGELLRANMQAGDLAPDDTDMTLEAKLEGALMECGSSP